MKFPMRLVARVCASSIAGAVGLAAVAVPAPCAAETVLEYFKKTKPLLDYRLRYEHVNQDGFDEEADAVTSRLRLGFETAPLWNTRLLAEGEWNWAVVEHYNDTTNGEVWYPTVADPATLELNRLHFTNTSLPQTTVTVGRQKVNLDDQRFIGSVGFRQNEQTFDALRIENKSLTNTTLTALYSIQVNRVFGNRSRQQDEDGDTVALNTGYQTPYGLLSGFGYFIDFDSRDASSSQTYGLRFSGKKAFEPVTAHYAFSYAFQGDAHQNTADYGAHYYLLDAAVEAKGFRAGLAYEVLGSDDGTSFQTPLATLHKFQGWADKFLVTPPDGVTDLYLPLQYVAGDCGELKKITAQAIYHHFEADRGGATFGDEIDLQLQTTIRGVLVSVKYADYFADDLDPTTPGVLDNRDTRKVWVSVEYSL